MLSASGILARFGALGPFGGRVIDTRVFLALTENDVALFQRILRAHELLLGLKTMDAEDAKDHVLNFYTRIRRDPVLAETCAADLSGLSAERSGGQVIARPFINKLTAVYIGCIVVVSAALSRTLGPQL